MVLNFELIIPMCELLLNFTLLSSQSCFANFCNVEMSSPPPISVKFSEGSGSQSPFLSNIPGKKVSWFTFSVSVVEKHPAALDFKTVGQCDICYITGRRKRQGMVSRLSGDF